MMLMHPNPGKNATIHVFQRVKPVGGLVVAWCFWCTTLRIPIRDLSGLFDTSFVGLAVVICEAELNSMNPKPLDQCLFWRFAGDCCFLLACKPRLNGRREFRCISRVLRIEIVGSASGFRKKEARFRAPCGKPSPKRRNLNQRLF
jgi:hypothetical protein